MRRVRVPTVKKQRSEAEAAAARKVSGRKTLMGQARARRSPRRPGELGATTDNPMSLASRALREALRAEADGDAVGMRQAAEKGWLAVSSLADLAAERLGRPAPSGASARREALRALETEARLRRGTFVQPFELARRQLHGECFHGDHCPANLVEVLEDFHEVVAAGVAAVTQLDLRRRR